MRQEKRAFKVHITLLPSSQVDESDLCKGIGQTLEVPVHLAANLQSVVSLHSTSFKKSQVSLQHPPAEGLQTLRSLSKQGLFR